MDKSILTKYTDAKARLEILRKRIEKNQEEIIQLEKSRHKIRCLVGMEDGSVLQFADVRSG
ncbi:MAG: hypothetical protein LUF92_15175 [Clostridiales bacterium]|nr:hypothetical protein [Clostridiales bacterium]